MAVVPGHLDRARLYMRWARLGHRSPAQPFFDQPANGFAACDPIGLGPCVDLGRKLFAGPKTDYRIASCRGTTRPPLFRFNCY
jgi:hypothetical protein